MKEILRQAVLRGHIRELDMHVALFLADLAQDGHKALATVAALTSRAVGDGHVCLPLAVIIAHPFTKEMGCAGLDYAAWRQNLLASSVVTRPDDVAPLILDDQDRIYLHRYFTYEEEVAGDLVHRASVISEDVDSEQVRHLLASLFPPPGALIDWQQIAAALAICQSLVILSGGPGTGKTYTVARILVLLQVLHGNSLRIGLAAPTGKAAARLQESIRQAKDCLAEYSVSLPEEALTLHRMLGVQRGGNGFRYHAGNHLHLDLLVVDEASMIDMPLMAALLAALPDTTRLLLLGDRDQLASVEAGSLFADLCGPSEHRWSPELCRKIESFTGQRLLSKPHALSLADNVVLLQTSHRFQGTETIGRFADVLNRGDMTVLRTMMNEKGEELVIHDDTEEKLLHWFREQVVGKFQGMSTAKSAQQALLCLEQMRVLCAVRLGTFGVENVNRIVEECLQRKGCIGQEERWYRGRPVMISRNDYGQGLYNGDTGIIWPDEQGQPYAWFKRSDDTLHPIAPARLPRHETAYAITVHKSQGSEFDEVWLILPPEDVPVLSRELLYTGVTRARKKLVVLGKQEILEKAVRRRALRYSGLMERFWPEEKKE